MSVRLPTADEYAAQVDKEHRWLPVLAPELPLAVPQPLARGVPGCGFPRPWSVYTWIEGQTATIEGISDLDQFATDLAHFLGTLYTIDASRGPMAGTHSFFRGGPLSVYDAETRRAIAELGHVLDARACARLWESALGATSPRKPVWIHGDVAPSNLLVLGGRLHAVIDFGCMAIGDPACDTVIAWTFFLGSSRARFKELLPVDDATWVRGRGWALWKALITEIDARRTGHQISSPVRFGWRQSPLSIVEDLLRDH